MNIVGISGQLGSGKDTVAKRLVEEHGFQQIALADVMKRFGYHVFQFDEIQLWGPSEARNRPDPRYTRCELRSKGISLSESTTSATIRKSCDPAWAAAAEALREYGPKWLQELVKDDADRFMESLQFWFVTLGHKFPELSPRVMLQSLGTEYGREEISEDIWIDVGLKTARKLLSTDRLVYDRLEGLVPDEHAASPAGVVVSDVRFHNELKAIKSAGGKVVRILRPETDQEASAVGIKGHVSEAEQKEFEVDQFNAVVNNNRSLDDLFDTVDTLAASMRNA